MKVEIAGANCHIWAKTDQLIFGRDPGKTICYPPHWRYEKENEEEIANIKLIAAAPDLLKALMFIVKEYPYVNGMIKAQEAIKKATE